MSNRGHDSVATFALDPTGNRLYAAKENSDTIVRFHLDGRTGRPTREGEIISTGSPACIVFSTM